MTSTPRRSLVLRLLPVTGLAAALAIGGLFLRCQEAVVSPHSRAYAYAYSPPDNRIQAAINKHDGVAFATLAMDITLAHPERFQRGASEEAFRANRPLMSWLAWATALGRHGAVEWALLVWSVLGVAALVFAAGWFAETVGADPRQAAVATLALPATAVLATYVGLADGVGTALSLFGMGLWLRDRRRASVAVLILAVLAKESGLLVVAALGLWEVFGKHQWRRAPMLLVPCAIYGAWTALVAWRLGYWPTSPEVNNHGGSGFRTSLPGLGLWRSLHIWGIDEVFALLLIATLVVLALRRCHRGPLAIFVALGVAYASATGWGIWGDVINFPRVLLPTTVVAIVMLLTPRESALHEDRSSARPAAVL